MSRAAASASASLPTVREVIGLEAVTAGLPEIVAGHEALGARVRWVHASDSAGVARLLVGGELLLSTGAGWPREPERLRGFVAELAATGLAGLVLELGAHHPEAPSALVAAAREHALALVVLHREVRFVAITEAVHERIISEQTAALRARDEVRELFTGLALRGSPADFVVRQLARTLGAPVILENLAHEVVTAEVPPARELELFARWEARSRQAHREALRRGGAPAPDDWVVVPVEAQGIRWGSLVALPGPAHPAGRASVLEQGAIALALGRLAALDDEWGRIGRMRLLEDLLGGRYTAAAAAAARVEAAGLPVEGACLLGVVATGAALSPETVDRAARVLRGRALTATLPAGAPGPGAAILLSLPGEAGLDDPAALAFARALAPDDRVALAIGHAARGLEDGLGSVQEAADLARDRRPGARFRRAEDRPLSRLLASLRDDHRVLEHGERMLAPLVEHDLARDGDLLDVLGAMLAHPTNRTAAAAASHLSRSVFYQRLALIAELLGADLDDGETQTALHLALLARRSSGR